MIIEDFIPRFYQQSILDSLTKTEISWTYVDNISGVKNKLSVPYPLNVCEEQNGFAHTFLGPSGVSDDSMLSLFHPMKYAIEEKIKKNIVVTRVRAGMFFSNGYSGIHFPHVDYYSPHKTMLYYVNDSDGDTILFNEKFDENNKNPSLSIMQSVSPKMGRAIIFDGLRYHSSSVPEKAKKRLTININFSEVE